MVREMGGRFKREGIYKMNSVVSESFANRFKGCNMLRRS